MEPYYSDGLPLALPGLCECGCGGRPGEGRRFITKHNLKVLVTRTDEHRQAISAACRNAWVTKRPRMALGSRRLDSKGYWLVKVREHGGRWDKEHVLVVEEAIGRRLVDGEQVHHINGVKTDNGIENLQLCANGSEHQLIEATFRRLLPGLLADGVIVFDREAKEYRRA